MLDHILLLSLLAFALSLDSFGVGITYGLRQLKIPLISIVIISVLSGMIIGLSMQLGVLLSQIISPVVASYIGAVILIVMGMWSLVQLLMQKERGQEPGVSSNHQREASSKKEPAERTVWTIELRKLGLVVQILRTPSSADVDNSGSISGWEAMWLGVALSLDAFGAGLGAALLGFPPLWTSMMIAVFSGTFLIAGMKAGFRFAMRPWARHVTALPALLLIVMGIIKLL